MNKRAIVTMVFNPDWEAVFEYSGAAMQRYANRVGADLIVKRARTSPNRHVHWEKLDAISGALEFYERVLWADVDVLMRDNAPSIFDQVPMGCVAGWNEGAHCNRNDEVELGCKFYGIEPPPPGSEPYFNAGVVLYDRSAKAMVKMPERELVSNMPEQTYQNIMRYLLKIPFYEVPLFNGLHAFHMDAERRRRLYFVHYAGHPKLEGWNVSIVEKMILDSQVG